MSKDFSSEASQTDWERIDAMQDDEIDYSDIPEVMEAQMKRAVLRIGGETVSKDKVQVNINLDADVITYFKMRAGGDDYQGLINETLRESMRTQHLEDVLRRIIREELQASTH